jgi:hypothetical protein
MSNKENYPDWGTFGTSSKSAKPRTEGVEQNQEGENSSTADDSMSDAGAVFHLTLGVMPDGTQTVKIEPSDKEADKARAWDWAEHEGWRAKLNSPEGERFRLSGKRDSLTAVIEMARCSAARHDDLHSVWAALERLAFRQEPPLLGFSDDGIDIKYRNGGETPVFTKKMLKRRLERQEEKGS